MHGSIEQLEESIKTERLDAISLRKELEKASSSTNILSSNATAKSDLELHQNLAESNFDDCIMTEKLYSWSPICIEASKITLHYKNSIPQLDFIVNFEEASSGRVTLSPKSFSLEESTKGWQTDKYVLY